MLKWGKRGIGCYPLRTLYKCACRKNSIGKSSPHEDSMKSKDTFGQQIPKIEAAIGYTFRDRSLLRQAFTRTSWCNEHPECSYQSNEVLEFFGDTALSIAIVSLLLGDSVRRYEHGIRTELGEGDFSNIKSRLSDKTNLSASTKKLGLEQYLLVGEGDAKLGIKDEPSVMEDLFESIIGAVYIDSDKNLDTVTRVVSGMLDMSVYKKNAPIGVSPKNALQEWCADKKRRLPPPLYKTLSEEGPDHKKTYERGVYVGERLIASAKGKNQKTADAEAAVLALEILIREDGEARPQPKADTERTALPEPKKEAVRSEKPGTKSKAKQKTESPTAALKRIAAESSVAGPVFRDLGLIAEGEHSVECSFLGQRAIATAETRSEAKEKAATTVLGYVKGRKIIG